MTSKDNNDVIIKVLENYTVRIESAISKTEKEVSEIHSEIRTLQNDVTILKSDTAHIQTSVYWGFAVIAFVVASVVALVPLLRDFFKALRKPVVTVEQVQDMIDKAIARAFSSIGK